jgi:hypothetical protein
VTLDWAADGHGRQVLGVGSREIERFVQRDFFLSVAALLGVVGARVVDEDAAHYLRRGAEVRYVEAGGIMAPVKSDLPQGTLDMLILQVVALDAIFTLPTPRSAQFTRRRPGAAGLLYRPARLENRKALVAEWKASERARRQMLPSRRRDGPTSDETANWSGCRWRFV